MWYDRDIDSIMDRTKSRPIPSGRVKSEEALTLGIVLSIFSIILLFVASNYIAAAFLFISIMSKDILNSSFKGSQSLNIL